MANIKFLKNAAPLGYGYVINDVAEFSDAQAAEFIERGFAEATDEQAQPAEPATEDVKTATAAKPATVKKAVKK